MRCIHGLLALEKQGVANRALCVEQATVSEREDCPEEPDGMQMTNYEIAGLLQEYQQIKKDTQGLRAEMMRLVVEELGIKQKVAQKTNLEAFLDGYLIGQEMMESCQRMSNYEISGLLNHCQKMKKNTRKLRIELLRVAVEELGMEQNVALQANLEVFLDGYLVGQGMIQSWRRAET